MRFFFIATVLFFFISCHDTPKDKIVNYAKEKYGNNFKEGVIDLSSVFDFKWDKMYMFSPLLYPQDITKAIGFKYEGDVVPDDNYLLLFTKDSIVVKQYPYFRLGIGFSDNNHTGVYMVKHENAKYKIVFRGKNDYWLYKIK